MVATLICLVTSQVISYVKARAEASGLSGDGGLIERPERLMIVLVGAGFSGLFGRAVAAARRDVGARGGQRDHARSAGAYGADFAGCDGAAANLGRRQQFRREARDAVTSTPAGQDADGGSRFSRVVTRGHVTDLGYATGWRLVRAMPELLARNTFDAGALYASRGGGPEQLRKNLARVIGVPPERRCRTA